MICTRRGVAARHGSFLVPSPSRGSCMNSRSQTWMATCFAFSTIFRGRPRRMNYVPRGRWINYAACLWALLFAAPHVWWALGFPAGFPGGLARGRANHQLMMTTWRYYFDVAVIFLSLLAIFVALALIRTWGRIIPLWILPTMALLA